MSAFETQLRFQNGNAKLTKGIWTFSLPAGHTCPGALQCRAFADRHTGKLTDGSQQIFRCYAASMEAGFPSVRKSRWHNRTLLEQCKSKQAMTDLIETSLPRNPDKIRIHASGDFYKQSYFDAWLDVIANHSGIIFYAYTKALNFWTERLEDIPANFALTASFGGRYDALIKEYSLRHVVVVGHPEEAAALNLPIDHDDSHAYTIGVDSFALLVHGMQPPNTAAAAAIKNMKEEGITYSYGRESESTAVA